MDKEEIEFYKCPEVTDWFKGILLAFSAYVLIMSGSGIRDYFVRNNVNGRLKTPLESTQIINENKAYSPPDIVQKLQNGNEPMNKQSGIDYKLQE